MDNFYELGSLDKRGEIYLSALVEYDDQALKRGDFKPSEPFHVKISEGKKLYDLVRYQDPFNFAVSCKFNDLLKSSGLSGWRTYPILIEGSQEEYFGFQVLGRSGLLKRPKVAGFVVGCEFDHISWDGSDFFMPLGTMSIFCTEKAKQVLTSQKFSNIGFEDIKSVKWYST